MKIAFFVGSKFKAVKYNTKKIICIYILIFISLLSIYQIKITQASSANIGKCSLNWTQDIAAQQKFDTTVAGRISDANINLVESIPEYGDAIIAFEKLSKNPLIWNPSKSLRELDEDALLKSESIANLYLLEIIRSFGLKSREQTKILIDKFVNKSQYFCLFNDSGAVIEYFTYIENITKENDPRKDIKFLDNMRKISFYFDSVRNEYINLLSIKKNYHLYVNQLDYFKKNYDINCKISQNKECLDNIKNIFINYKKDDRDIAKGVVCNLKAVHSNKFVNVSVC